MLARAGRLSSRAQVLASAAGAAAPLWERLNALASRPGMVNMSQGMPDFAGSPIARRVAAEALESGGASLNQYSPQPGLIDLRQAVSAFVDQRYGATYDPATEVAITAGGQEESDPLSPLLCYLCYTSASLPSAPKPLSLSASLRPDTRMDSPAPAHAALSSHTHSCVGCRRSRPSSWPSWTRGTR